MLFITSSVDVTRLTEGDLSVHVTRARGDKCPRCWRYVTDAQPDGDMAGLCGRCVDALGGQLVAGR
jgi:isoleucyl-tRNA synthetase